MRSIDRVLITNRSFEQVHAAIAEDTSPVIFSDLPIDAPIRYFLNKHYVGMAGLSRTHIPVAVREWMRFMGVSRAHFLHLKPYAEACYDKVLHVTGGSVFEITKEAFPRPYKAKFIEQFRTQGDLIRKAFGQISHKILDLPELELFEIRIEDLQRDIESQ